MPMIDEYIVLRICVAFLDTLCGGQQRHGNGVVKVRC